MQISSSLFIIAAAFLAACNMATNQTTIGHGVSSNKEQQYRHARTFLFELGEHDEAVAYLNDKYPVAEGHKALWISAPKGERYGWSSGYSTPSVAMQRAEHECLKHMKEDTKCVPLMKGDTYVGN